MVCVCIVRYSTVYVYIVCVCEYECSVLVSSVKVGVEVKREFSPTKLSSI